ncbi:MAG: 5'-nucleotidase C-terminal domain-containing protein [Bacteroidales bacterium]|nr:5'-nucleotidase C-terminal domain-containing protein [Bacteroidales bacterium]HRX31430.1 5'-nucleotidase C-terminal domain-containing protein [Tenuifilaceae bacterium]
MKKFALSLFMLFAAYLAFSQHSVNIKILETSDVHGAIFPYDFIRNETLNAGLARAYTYIKQERANPNQQVILLDNGDILQGQPTVYYSNFVDTLNPNIVSRVFNYMKYDAGTVGNHDIEAGPKVYRKVEREFNFPWMAANAVDTRTGKPTFKPYTIIERNGVKVAVLGLITPGISKWLPSILWPNMKFNDMIESATYWVKYIKQNENPDIMVGLFHSGHNPEYGGASPSDSLNENASLLVAQKVPGFDVILIGHDHDEFNQKVQNVNGDSVLILDPRSSAKLVSDCSITLNYDKDGKLTSKHVSGQLVKTAKFEPDPQFMNEFKDYYNTVSEYVKEPVGTFTKTISSADAYFGPCDFIDFINQSQLDLTDTDISFAAPLSFISKIKEGTITVSDMFKLYRYENFLYTMMLKGSEVDAYLEYSVSLWFNTMKEPSDHLLKFTTDANGYIVKNKQGQVELVNRYYNFDAAAGINYIVDVTKPDGDKVTILSMADGTPFNPNKMYKVAVNSYRGNGGGGHLTKGAGLTPEQLQERIVNSTDRDIRLLLMNYIKSKGTITPKKLNSWKIVPDKLVQNAIKTDRLLLFGSSNHNE